MISKVYEWLRAADLKPDDQMVTTRTKAVEDLVNRIREAEDFDLLLGSVTAAVGGCQILGEQSPEFSTILECVRTQAPAFPSAIAENGLHLRVICCIALGELLNSDDDLNELLSSSLLVASLGLKPKEAGRHLDKVFEELGNIARTNLQKQSLELRKRANLNWKTFDGLKASMGDSPTFNQNLLPAVKSLIQSLQKQHESDREELDVMWWLYNGYSEHLSMQVKSATPHLAAMAIGTELADKITPPATIGLTGMVAQAAVRDRSAPQIKAKALRKIVTELGDAGRKLLLPSADNVRTFVRENGVLLPLSWLCLRLEDSQGANGWEAELQSKTRLLSDHEMTSAELATQVFAERQAQRVHESLVEATA